VEFHPTICAYLCRDTFRCRGNFALYNYRRRPSGEQCSRMSGPLVGLGGGTTETPDETGRQNVVRPRPKIPRTADIRTTGPAAWGGFCRGAAGNYVGPLGTAGGRGGPRGTTGDGGKQRETSENSGTRRGTTEDGGGRRGTTQCRPSSSWPRADGLPRCEHWWGGALPRVSGRLGSRGYLLGGANRWGGGMEVFVDIVLACCSRES